MHVSDEVNPRGFREGNERDMRHEITERSPSNRARVDGCGHRRGSGNCDGARRGSNARR
jgi:hypothetical protein